MEKFEHGDGRGEHAANGGAEHDKPPRKARFELGKVGFRRKRLAIRGVGAAGDAGNCGGFQFASGGEGVEGGRVHAESPTRRRGRVKAVNAAPPGRTWIKRAPISSMAATSPASAATSTPSAASRARGPRASASPRAQRREQAQQREAENRVAANPQGDGKTGGYVARPRHQASRQHPGGGDARRDDAPIGHRRVLGDGEHAVRRGDKYGGVGRDAAAPRRPPPVRWR